MRTETDSRQSWRVRDIFYIIIIYLAIFVCFLYIEIIVFGKGVLEDTNSNPWLVSIEDFVDAFILTALPIFFVKKCYKADLKEVGFTFQNIGRNLFIGLLFGVLLWFVVSMFGEGIKSIWGQGPKHPYLQKLEISRGSVVTYIVVLISISILSPISEEIYFRGFTYTILRKRWGMTVGLVVSSLLFSATHLSLWYAFQIFIIGAGLAFLYERTSSLIPVIAAHGTINLLTYLSVVYKI